MSFTKATKKQARGRIALEAPAGYGKTYTALLIATQLLEGTGKRIAYLDTEGRGQGSASKYAHLFDFDVDEIGPPFHPDRIVTSIEDAVANDYGAWIGDSWTHFWKGDGGMLDIVDQIAKTKYRGDSHSAWKDAGKIEQKVLDTLLGAPLHVIVCMRMKTDTVREEYEKDGRTRTRIRKAGLKAEQREGFDYEFDFVGKFEQPAILTVDKSRIDTLPPETFILRPAFLGDGASDAGKTFVPTLKAWLSDGAAAPELERAATKEQTKLSKVIAELSKLAPAPGKFGTWDELIDAWARREFDHGVAALTVPQMAQTIAIATDHVKQLKAAGAVGEEPKQEALEGAAA